MFKANVIACQRLGSARTSAEDFEHQNTFVASRAASVEVITVTRHCRVLFDRKVRCSIVSDKKKYLKLIKLQENDNEIYCTFQHQKNMNH